ncbi:retrovirus-related pol polyprotein from transposon TNT 1-94 [Tanacetum coccineum]
MKAASYPDFGFELLVPEQMWIDDVCTYDVSAKYGISHWWFTRQKFYTDRHESPSRRKEVRTHMRILSVVSIKAYSRYEYEYLSEIVLRRADHQEHKIVEKDFKNLQTDAINCCQVVDPKLSDSTAGYEFKHDYTIIESPRAVIFPVNNNERKIMRFNEIYKFSDGMLARILEILDYRVKEFKIKQLNPEHPSDTNVLTMKMEILLEPTSNKLLGTVVLATLFNESEQRHFRLFITNNYLQEIPDGRRFRNSDEYNHDPEKCEHAGPKVTTSHGGNNTTRMIWRFTVADDLKECSKITQVKGTMLKDYYSSELQTDQVSSFSSYTRRFQDVKLARIYIDEIIAWNGILHPQADGQSERIIQTLEDIIRACVVDFGGSYQLSIRCAPFKALYGRKCWSPILWAEIRESSLTELELVLETANKVVLIKEKPKAVRDLQKSYVDYRCKPLGFEVGDHVLLVVKGVAIEVWPNTE